MGAAARVAFATERISTCVSAPLCVRLLRSQSCPRCTVHAEMSRRERSSSAGAPAKVSAPGPLFNFPRSGRRGRAASVTEMSEVGK